MRINIPERVRRIAVAIGAPWLAGCLAHAPFSDATVRIHDAFQWPDAPPEFVAGCGVMGTPHGKGACR